MEAYKKQIDYFLIEMQHEKESNHEPLTKVLNFEYYNGKLYGLYTIAEKELTPEAFTELYEYNRATRENLYTFFNAEYINPLYNIARKYTKGAHFTK